MGEDSTITDLPDGGNGVAAAPRRPHLVVVTISDDPGTPSSRHLLDAVDEVRFGRGPRSVHRATIDGKRVLELRIPDARMSGGHGRLQHYPMGWVLDDPVSKNGAVVNGEITRSSIIENGALIELGHTFLLFGDQPVETGAADDVFAGDLDGPAAFATFVGPLAEGFAALSRLATTPVSVVLLGDTGTGKEVVARALHARSGRSGAFVAVNCGALPASLIEAELFGHRRGAFAGAVGERLGLIRSAEGGTLFLDEIGELPAAAQAALLRVLQDREVTPVGDDRPVKVDVRLCAATHRDLAAMVQQGKFRDDLFGRLAGFTLELPPLRNRRADLGLLLRALLAGIPGAEHVRFSPSALRTLINHRWPLNIRALEKTLLTAVTLATDGVIELPHLADLPRRTTGDASGPELVIQPRTDDSVLRDRLIGLLTTHRGNVVAVSRAIGTRRTQIYRWARRLGIDLTGFRN